MKVLFLLGTRPEAIKLAPVILAMKCDSAFRVSVCVTAQHRHMLDQVLHIFKIEPDYDLDLMTSNQTLSELTSRAIDGIDKVIKSVMPDLCIVQGDTTSVLSAAIASFYNRIRIAHVEAGLRTFDKHSPYPEEMNRVLTTKLCDIHFAPTHQAKVNLLQENINETNILVAGNTVIDALYYIKREIESERLTPDFGNSLSGFRRDMRFILVTSHRRENFGNGIESICKALRRFAETYKSVNVVFPVHPNPNVYNIVKARLEDLNNVFLVPPLDYVSFVSLMKDCLLVLTDSGGVQEEAPAFGKPVLIMRDFTERPEAINAGVSKLVGTDENKIFDALSELIEDDNLFKIMSHGGSPYGDGKASGRILSYLKELDA